MREALVKIESMCDGTNDSHEFIWYVAYEAIGLLEA